MDESGNLYVDFFRIEAASYHEKVRFYERHKQYLHLLRFEEQVELKADYLQALFEVGKYRKFLKRVDQLIETVIEDNIYEVNGTPIFEKLLFTKAACQYNLQRYDQAKHITGQLLKINPTFPMAQNLFTKSLRKCGEPWYEINKAVAVVLMLSGISLTFAQLLIVDPFYEQYTSEVTLFRNFLVVIAITFLLYNEWKVKKVCEKVKRK